MASKNIEHHQSLLDFILSVFTKNDDTKQLKEIKRYDSIQFEDVNKEIKNRKKLAVQNDKVK